MTSFVAYIEDFVQSIIKIVKAFLAFVGISIDDISMPEINL